MFKKKSFLFTLFLIPIFAFGQYTLTVTIEGLKSQGIVYAGLYNGPTDFLNEAGMIKQFISTKTQETLVYEWKDLPKGNYSIAFLEDLNGDGVMNFNFIGMPKERYGFFPNQSFRLREPTWEECNFQLTNNMKVVLSAK